jgi:hypothetical protein
VEALEQTQMPLQEAQIPGVVVAESMTHQLAAQAALAWSLFATPALFSTSLVAH